MGIGTSKKTGQQAEEEEAKKDNQDNITITKRASDLKEEEAAFKLLYTMSPPRPPLERMCDVQLIGHTLRVSLDMNATVFAAKRAVITKFRQGQGYTEDSNISSVMQMCNAFPHNAQHCILLLDDEKKLDNQDHLDDYEITDSSTLELLPPPVESKSVPKPQESPILSFSRSFLSSSPCMGEPLSPMRLPARDVHRHGLTDTD